MNRRNFVNATAAFSVFGIGLWGPSRLLAQTSPDMSTFNSLFDISAAPSHCNQAHDHSTCPWPNWAAGDWKGMLDWSRRDTGFNEGAQAAVELLNAATIQLPPVLANLGGAAVGNVWKRVDMMNFGHYLALTGSVGAGTGLGILSQWHNCHCFCCLFYNAPNVAGYMVGWP